MIDLVTGCVALLLLVVFLGHYAFIIASPALWLIIVAIVLMAAADFVMSVRSGGGSPPS